MKKRSEDLTTGPVVPLLARLTWPMLMGLAGMIFCDVVNSIYIGHLGVTELAALTLTFPVVMVISSVSMGIGVGISATLSQVYINGQHKTIQRYASQAIALLLCFTLLITVIGVLTVEPLFGLFGADGALVPLAADYMRIRYIAFFASAIPGVGNNILRATGDTLRPGMIMLYITIANIVLDPVLIFGLGFIPAMGIRGAAVATLISMVLGLVLSLNILIRKERLLALSNVLVGLWATWRRIARVALPAALGTLVIPLSTGLATRLFAGYGEETLAAFGIVYRLEMLVFLIILSIASVMTIFAGQNIAADKPIRIREAFAKTTRFTLAWSALVVLLSLIPGNHFIGLFSDDSRVLAVVSDYLTIVAFSYGFNGILIIGSSVLNGINRPTQSLYFIVFKMLGLYLPLVFLGSWLFGLTGIYWAIFVANLLPGIACLFFLRYRVLNH